MSSPPLQQFTPTLSPLLFCLFSHAVTMSDTNNIMENGNGVGGGGGRRPPSAPNSGNYSPSSGMHNNIATATNQNNNTTPSKAAIQMQKLVDANTKYKNLLKMAKERIEQQEEELKKLKGGYIWIYFVRGVLWHVVLERERKEGGSASDGLDFGSRPNRLFSGDI
jgi:hypothetical protein